MTQPEVPPEGKLLRLARESHQPRKLSAREAARRAGVSESHWRHVENGFEPRGGMRIPVHSAADTLARMALAVSVAPAEMEAVRPDAARLMREMAARKEAAPAPGIELSEDDLDRMEKWLGVDLSKTDPELRRAVLSIGVAFINSAGAGPGERDRSA
jgi:Helix-turn-helix domain